LKNGRKQVEKAIGNKIKIALSGSLNEGIEVRSYHSSDFAMTKHSDHCEKRSDEAIWQLKTDGA